MSEQYTDKLEIHRPDIVSLLECVVEGVKEGYTVLDTSNDGVPLALFGMFRATLLKPAPDVQLLVEQGLYDGISSEELLDKAVAESDPEKRNEIIEAANKAIALEAAREASLTTKGKPRDPRRDPGMKFNPK